jgi:hypothetical protein
LASPEVKADRASPEPEIRRFRTSRRKAKGEKSRKMTNFDKSLDLEIGGESKKLKFTVGAILELEKSLGKSALALALEPPLNLSVGDLVEMAYHGLKHADKKLTRQQTADWVMEYLRSHDTYNLSVMLAGALGLSGIAGDVSVFADMIARLTQPGAPPEDNAGE